MSDIADDPSPEALGIRNLAAMTGLSPDDLVRPLIIFATKALRGIPPSLRRKAVEAALELAAVPPSELEQALSGDGVANQKYFDERVFPLLRRGKQ